MWKHVWMLASVGLASRPHGFSAHRSQDILHNTDQDEMVPADE